MFRTGGCCFYRSALSTGDGCFTAELAFVVGDERLALLKPYAVLGGDVTAGPPRLGRGRGLYTFNHLEPIIDSELILMFLRRYIPDLNDTSTSLMSPRGSRIIFLVYLGQFLFWVGYVLYRSCTTSHKSRLGSR